MPTKYNQQFLTIWNIQFRLEYWPLKQFFSSLSWNTEISKPANTILIQESSKNIHADFNLYIDVSYVFDDHFREALCRVIVLLFVLYFTPYVSRIYIHPGSVIIFCPLY